MGGDGGSIPKRDDLVKTRTKPEQVGKHTELLTRWKHCALTQEPLRPPIVSCQLGRLFNKESFIEFLLDRSKFECASRLSYIRNLKDVKELNLSDNPAFTSESRKSGCVERVTPYICPITGLEMNGRYRFCYLLGCGCVFADRALKEIKDSICIKCGKMYTDDDIVIINGTEEDMAALQIKMEERRLLAKSSKVSKKRKVPVETSSESASRAEPASHCSETKSDNSHDAHSSAVEDAETERTAHQPKVARSESFRPATSSAVGKPGTSAGPSASGKDKKLKTIQDDPKASLVFKSLFNTHETAKKQQHAHWVTYNPQYF